ncbi:MAG: HlyD family secretion protein [Candidatus Eremiobacteraeota bacterium]|nr:HlyD family secretion protein [Candidatus Eremiobacteraeota bacterium]
MDSPETRSAATIPKNGKTEGVVANGTASPAPAEATPRAVNPNSRRILMAVGAVAVIALLIWGVRFFAYARSHQSTDDARIDASIVSVTSKISERVEGIHVATDQSVAKGQLLITLDNHDEQARLDQAEAAVNAQRAQAAAAQANVSLTQQTVAAQALEGLGGIAQAQSGISNAQSNVGAAQGQVGAAQAAVTSAQAAVPSAQQALARASADFSRTQSLVSSGDVPRQQLDAARANQAAAQAQYESALAGVSAARERLVSAQAQAGGASSGIGAAQGSLQTAQGRYQEQTSPSRVAASEAQANAAYANVASLQAQLSLARRQLAETKIYSPIDGYIGEKNIEIGQTIGPGSTLITIIPSKNIFVTANFKETQVGDMHAGQPVDIKVDAYHGVEFHGHVIAINPASQNTYSLVPAQNASGNFIKVTQRIPVKIGIDNPPADKPLRPGMSVEASVKVK